MSLSRHSWQYYTMQITFGKWWKPRGCYQLSDNSLPWLTISSDLAINAKLKLSLNSSCSESIMSLIIDPVRDLSMHIAIMMYSFTYLSNMFSAAVFLISHYHTILITQSYWPSMYICNIVHNIVHNIHTIVIFQTDSCGMFLHDGNWWLENQH